MRTHETKAAKWTFDFLPKHISHWQNLPKNIHRAMYVSITTPVIWELKWKKEINFRLNLNSFRQNYWNSFITSRNDAAQNQIKVAKTLFVCLPLWSMLRILFERRIWPFSHDWRFYHIVIFWNIFEYKKPWKSGGNYYFGDYTTHIRNWLFH